MPKRQPISLVHQQRVPDPKGYFHLLNRLVYIVEVRMSPSAAVIINNDKLSGFTFQIRDIPLFTIHRFSGIAGCCPFDFAVDFEINTTRCRCDIPSVVCRHQMRKFIVSPIIVNSIDVRVPCGPSPCVPQDSVPLSCLCLDLGIFHIILTTNPPDAARAARGSVPLDCRPKWVENRMPLHLFQSVRSPVSKSLLNERAEVRLRGKTSNTRRTDGIMSGKSIFFTRLSPSVFKNRVLQTVYG